MHPNLTRSLRLLGLLETGRRIELSLHMRQPRELPDAVILGAQKCGTSSLHNYLTQHPGVIAPLRKEVHYFDLNYGRGEAWYRAHFGRQGEPGLNLDSSPYYLFHPAVPRRMRALLPDVRLIVLLRDPVRRAYSHMLSGFQALDRLAASPDTFAGGASDKPPLAFGLLYLERVVHGIKASKLLLTQGDSSGRETLYTYYGFITREKTQRIMIYCPSDIEQTDFIAGEAFRALVHALATWLDDPANARLVGKWEKGVTRL